MEIILIFSFNSWKEKKQLNFGKFSEMDTRVYEPISETAIDVLCRGPESDQMVIVIYSTA